MKGTLQKNEYNVWVVRYRETTPLSITTETLPLHPEFIGMMDTCFTSKFTQEVEFEIVTEWENGEVGVNGLTYAKLINNVPDTYAWESPFDFVCQDPDCPHCIEEINQMRDDDDDDDLEDYVYELAETYYGPGHYGLESKQGFIKGYNKAKETLYTKQDVIDAVNRMYDIFMDDTFEAKMLRLKGISWHIQNTLESLKQHKQ
jgi:hypothetical protein